MKPKIAVLHLLLCTSLFLSFFTLSYGQLTKTWVNNYVDRRDTDNLNYTYIKGNKLQFDGSGNCYFFSEFNTLAANQQSTQAKMQTIKYSSSGSIIWTHRDSGTTFNQCYYCGAHPQEMIVNSDGTSYGVARDGFGSPNPAFLASTKPTGISNWNNSRDANGAIDILEDYQGNICLTTNGQTINGYGLESVILSKINAAGNTNWTNHHVSPDGLGYTGDQKVVTDKKGNFFVAASTYHYGGNGGSDLDNLFLTKFDSSGKIVWESKFDSTGIPRVTGFLYNTVDDYLYLSYYKVENDTLRLKIAKISNADSVYWIKTEIYPGGTNVWKQDNQGNAYLWLGPQGYGESYNPGYNLDGTIIKYNSAGSELGRMTGNSFDVDASGYTYTTHELVKGYSVYDAVKKYSPSGVLLFDSPISYFAHYNGYGYGSEAYKDNSTGLYLLSEYPGSDTISVTKYNAACTAKSAPAKPKSITGSAVIYCDNTYYTYSCPAVASAFYYNWTVPTGVVVDSGQGTTKLYVHGYNGFKTGKVNVYASNCFGASATLTKVVTDTLKPTTKITGATSVCKGQQNVEYTAQAVAGATYYQWTIPADASFAQGYGNGMTYTPVVHINFGNTGGKVSVVAENYCDTSVAKSIQIKVTNCVSGMSVEAESNKSLVYPNPSSGVFTLRLGSEYHSSVSVIVKDVTGKVVERLSSITGSNFRFGDKLVKGVYFVEITNGGEKEVLRVVKE